ncbi:MAG: helix-turn-helix domain-containing protein [Chloroflexota bacterium]
MNYETFQPHRDLDALVKYYWTLEVPAEYESKKQQIIPDGCIELAFILEDDIKRYISENEFILQPRSMVIGQRSETFYIEPVGRVHSFAVSFYPYGFANFISSPIKALANKETPIASLFGDDAANALEKKILQASDTQKRIKVIEAFLFDRLNGKTTVDHIVKTTVDLLLSTNGSTPISQLINQDLSKRRQLERKFVKQIGLSPKQLGKVIRLQSALKLLLNDEAESLTHIAYESDYYDQAHFIKDFKRFTGMNPSAFLGHKEMALSSLFYK